MTAKCTTLILAGNGAIPGDAVLVMATAVDAMLEHQGQGSGTNVERMESKQTPRMAPQVQGMANIQPPITTRLPYPGEDMYFVAPDWMKAKGRKPTLSDTAEWQAVSGFIKGTGKYIVILVIGVLASDYIKQLLELF